VILPGLFPAKLISVYLVACSFAIKSAARKAPNYFVLAIITLAVLPYDVIRVDCRGLENIEVAAMARHEFDSPSGRTIGVRMVRIKNQAWRRARRARRDDQRPYN